MLVYVRRNRISTVWIHICCHVKCTNIWEICQQLTQTLCRLQMFSVLFISHFTCCWFDSFAFYMHPTLAPILVILLFYNFRPSYKMCLLWKWSVWSLQCYSCRDDHWNWGECTEKIEQCAPFQDACVAYAQYTRKFITKFFTVWQLVCLFLSISCSDFYTLDVK